MNERLVHFIWLGGEFLWGHARAMSTAHLHGAPIIVWCASPIPRWRVADLKVNCGVHVEERTLELPDRLRDHPIRLANVKDLYAWQILYEHGGLYLDLDTISLAPVWDLLDRDVLISSEHEPGFDAGHPYNSAVVAAHRSCVVVRELAERAEEILKSGESTWGAIGPHLLTEVVGRHPGAFSIAPFGALSGWRDDTIYRYYDGEPPPEGTRVIHCYSSSRPDRFAADRWWPQ